MTADVYVSSLDAVVRAHTTRPCPNHHLHDHHWCEDCDGSGTVPALDTLTLSQPPPCMFHGYTEQSARHRLARSRNRGEDDMTAIFHRMCGKWHVERNLLAVQSTAITVGLVASWDADTATRIETETGVKVWSPVLTEQADGALVSDFVGVSQAEGQWPRVTRFVPLGVVVVEATVTAVTPVIDPDEYPTHSLMWYAVVDAVSEGRWWLWLLSDVRLLGDAYPVPDDAEVLR
jgi:hypothetical protein